MYLESELPGVDGHPAAVHQRLDVGDGLRLQNPLTGDRASAVVGQRGRKHAIALAVHLQGRQLINANFKRKFNEAPSAVDGVTGPGR